KDAIRRGRGSGFLRRTGIEARLEEIRLIRPPDRIDRVVNGALRHSHVDLEGIWRAARRWRERREGIRRDLVPVRDLVGLHRCRHHPNDERHCDQRQNWYFSKLSQRIHCSFLLVSRLPFIAMKKWS